MDGFGALAPNWIRPLSLSGSTEAVEAKRFEGLVVAAANNGQNPTFDFSQTPLNPLPLARPSYRRPLARPEIVALK